jgi:hypothetical protein
MPEIAAVPPADPAPRRTSGGSGKPRPDRTKPDGGDKPDKPVAGSVRGSIAEFGEEGGGVRIVINKGEDDGIEVGWTGYIVSKATKKKLPGSNFTVKTVRSAESEATVGVSADEVQANRTVILLKGSN